MPSTEQVEEEDEEEEKEEKDEEDEEERLDTHGGCEAIWWGFVRPSMKASATQHLPRSICHAASVI